MHRLGLLETDGFAGVSGVLSPAEVNTMINALGATARPGRRGLLGVSIVADLARSDKLLRFVRPYLPSEPTAVRAIYFNKSPDANWLVAWHQDLTLAVRSQVEIRGFGPWSTKEGVPHVQPPVQLLEQMLTVRLHLDDCDETNGALRVIPGSHRLGRLSADRVREFRERHSHFVCRMCAGDALLMRPLLLHASGLSRSPRH